MLNYRNQSAGQLSAVSYVLNIIGSVSDIGLAILLRNRGSSWFSLNGSPALCRTALYTHLANDKSYDVFQLTHPTDGSLVYDNEATWGKPLADDGFRFVYMYKWGACCTDTLLW